MLTRFAPVLVTSQGAPKLVCNEAAVLPCGCICYVGRQVPSFEAGVHIDACSDRHIPMMDDVREAIVRSLELPQPVPMVLLVDDLMGQIRGAWGLRW